MWYKYRYHLLNLSQCKKIIKSVSQENGMIFYDLNDCEFIHYNSEEERDAEFEKISKMLGLDEPEHISRCC